MWLVQCVPKMRAIGLIIVLHFSLLVKPLLISLENTIHGSGRQSMTIICAKSPLSDVQQRSKMYYSCFNDVEDNYLVSLGDHFPRNCLALLQNKELTSQLFCSWRSIREPNYKWKYKEQLHSNALLAFAFCDSRRKIYILTGSFSNLHLPPPWNHIILNWQWCSQDAHCTS